MAPSASIGLRKPNSPKIHSRLAGTPVFEKVAASLAPLMQRTGLGCFRAGSAVRATEGRLRGRGPWAATCDRAARLPVARPRGCGVRCRQASTASHAPPNPHPSLPQGVASLSRVTTCFFSGPDRKKSQTECALFKRNIALFFVRVVIAGHLKRSTVHR